MAAQGCGVRDHAVLSVTEKVRSAQRVGWVISPSETQGWFVEHLIRKSGNTFWAEGCRSCSGMRLVTFRKGAQGCSWYLAPWCHWPMQFLTEDHYGSPAHQRPSRRQKAAWRQGVRTDRIEWRKRLRIHARRFRPLLVNWRQMTAQSSPLHIWTDHIDEGLGLVLTLA